MKKIFLLVVTLMFFTFGGIQSLFAKDKLIILNAGTKTGSFAQQMTAISKDLEPYYNIDLRIPGGHCKAIAMQKNIKVPTLMPLANDYEAVGRDGLAGSCGTFAIEPSQVVRYGVTAMYVCSMKHDAESFMKNSHSVGHTHGAANARAVIAINDSFGANLKPVGYDGSGATKTGLYNGEVDYVLLSAKHGQKVIKNGGQCFYEYSADKNSPYIALATLDPSNRYLTMSMSDLWLALNMNADETEKLRTLIRSLHNDSSSAIAAYIGKRDLPKVIWDLSDDEINEKWELSVQNLQEPK